MARSYTLDPETGEWVEITDEMPEPAAENEPAADGGRGRDAREAGRGEEAPPGGPHPHAALGLDEPLRGHARAAAAVTAAVSSRCSRRTS